MNILVSKINWLSTIKVFLLFAFASACALSIKAAYDLAEFSSVFPVWFVPGFMLGISGLIATSLFLISKTMKVETHPHLLTGRLSIYLWVFMSLSFICTTAVHSFYPFRLDFFAILPGLDSVLKLNFTIAMAGFIASTMLAITYIFSQNKSFAIIGLLILALLTLIPNDNCSNPFNYWWINNVGASPLMYVPNLYAALFVSCGLLGIHPKVITILVSVTCIGTLLLGVGHMLGVIW